MSPRQALLVDLAQYAAIGAGIYMGTRGRLPWLALLIPLVLVIPFSFYRRVRHQRSKQADDHVRTPPAT